MIRTLISNRYLFKYTIKTFIFVPNLSSRARIAESRHEEFQLVKKILSVHLVEPQLLERFRKVLPLLVLDDGSGEEVFGRGRRDVDRRLSCRNVSRRTVTHRDVSVMKKDGDLN